MLLKQRQHKLTLTGGDKVIGIFDSGADALIILQITKVIIAEERN